MISLLKSFPAPQPSASGTVSPLENQQRWRAWHASAQDALARARAQSGVVIVHVLSLGLSYATEEQRQRYDMMCVCPIWEYRVQLIAPTVSCSASDVMCSRVCFQERLHLHIQMHPALVHTPCSIGMSHMAESTCCSSVAFERPNENTCTFTSLLGYNNLCFVCIQLCLLLRLCTPSGFLVVFEKPNRSSFTFTLSCQCHPAPPWSPCSTC